LPGCAFYFFVLTLLLMAYGHSRETVCKQFLISAVIFVR